MLFMKKKIYFFFWLFSCNNYKPTYVFGRPMQTSTFRYIIIIQLYYYNLLAIVIIEWPHYNFWCLIRITVREIIE